jgi:hypothetical protein
MLWEFEVESKCGCLKILLNKKIVRPTCQSQAPLKRHLTPALPTAHHVCSMRDACSHRPMRDLVAVSVHGRSRLSSSRDSRRTKPTPLCSRHAPLLPHRRTSLLQAQKCQPPCTALMRLCATPSRLLSHCPPQETIEALSRPPPSAAEAALPSSATSDHRRAPLSPQRPPLELTAAP